MPIFNSNINSIQFQFQFNSDSILFQFKFQFQIIFNSIQFHNRIRHWVCSRAQLHCRALSPRDARARRLRVFLHANPEVPSSVLHQQRRGCLRRAAPRALLPERGGPGALRPPHQVRLPLRDAAGVRPEPGVVEPPAGGDAQAVGLPVRLWVPDGPADTGGVPRERSGEAAGEEADGGAVQFEGCDAGREGHL